MKPTRSLGDRALSVRNSRPTSRSLGCSRDDGFPERLRVSRGLGGESAHIGLAVGTARSRTSLCARPAMAMHSVPRVAVAVAAGAGRPAESPRSRRGARARCARPTPRRAARRVDAGHVPVATRAGRCAPGAYRRPRRQKRTRRGRRAGRPNQASRRGFPETATISPAAWERVAIFSASGISVCMGAISL